MTLKAAYHTIRITASKDIDLSSSGRGDHDMLVPFLATQDWIRSLNYSIIDHWRPWMVHNQVAAGGGHTIEYKPDENYFMFRRWVSGQPL
ncbi:hypothetical protein DY000_02004812 [Brassica cretica]|uniref:Uncharacterized protein n=1 Tax=Brassica cretica TaxID=69181 RepID=A0ABQ7C3N1_BRACR|nr:hypothetical protein DY000_02004812 [Brassica cretica]